MAWVFQPLPAAGQQDAGVDREFSGALAAGAAIIAGNLSVIGDFSGALAAAASVIAGNFLTSTPYRVGFSQVDASAGNGSTSVTVPSDATLGVAFWAHWDSNGNTTLSALTLNSVGFSFAAQVAEGAVTDEGGTGVAVLENPSTGSQTLAWTWSAGGARTEGGWIVVVWYANHKSGDPYNVAGVDANTATGDAQVALSAAVAGEMVVAAAQCFENSTPAISGTVFINNTTVNQQIYDASEAIATGSHTVTMTGEDFSTMAAIALKMNQAGALTFSGALASPEATLAGNLSVIGGFSGALAAPSSTMAGNVSVIVELNGSLLSGSALMTGDVSVIVAFNGGLLAGVSVLDGVLSPRVDFDGVLLSDVSTISGAVTVDEAGAITFDGSLLSSAATLSGDLSIIVDFNGALASGSASISGAFELVTVFSGDLLAGPATASGSLSVLADFAGALSSADATIASALSVIVGVSGNLGAGPSTIAGNASIIVGFSGALLSPPSSIIGDLSVIAGFSGSLLAQAALLAGDFFSVDRVFSGSLASDAATMSGNVSVLVDFNGSLFSREALIEGNVSILVDFSGSILAGSSTLLGEFRRVFPELGVRWEPTRRGHRWRLRVGKGR